MVAVRRTDADAHNVLHLTRSPPRTASITASTRLGSTYTSDLIGDFPMTMPTARCPRMASTTSPRSNPSDYGIAAETRRSRTTSFSSSMPDRPRTYFHRSTSFMTTRSRSARLAMASISSLLPTGKPTSATRWPFLTSPGSRHESPVDAYGVRGSAGSTAPHLERGRWLCRSVPVHNISPMRMSPHNASVVPSRTTF